MMVRVICRRFLEGVGGGSPAPRSRGKKMEMAKAPESGGRKMEMAKVRWKLPGDEEATQVINGSLVILGSWQGGSVTSLLLSYSNLTSHFFIGMDITKECVYLSMLFIWQWSLCCDGWIYLMANIFALASFSCEHIRSYSNVCLRDIVNPER